MRKVDEGLASEYRKLAVLIQEHEEALRKKWASKSNPDQLSGILETLDANKTQYGSYVGKLLPVPAALEELFKKIDAGSVPAMRIGKAA